MMNDTLITLNFLSILYVIITMYNPNPVSSQLYPANFDDSSFNKFKTNEFNRLNSDACYNQQKDVSNNKKLKFVTTNFKDLIDAKEKLNFFGIGMRDQLFVPSDKIDTYSNLLNGQNGDVLTNCKVKNGFGQLPMPTMPYRGQLHHGDVTIEDSMREIQEVNKKSILPRDNNFQTRSFAIFTPTLDIPIPQAVQSVETPQIGFQLGRNGDPTRFSQKYDGKEYSSSGTDFLPYKTY